MRGLLRRIGFQGIVSSCRSNFQKQLLITLTVMKHLKDSIYWLYFQYMLVTCCSEFEPWEQMITHVVTATIVFMLVFTAYIVIPLQLHLIFQFFSAVLGCVAREDTDWYL